MTDLLNEINDAVEKQFVFEKFIDIEVKMVLQEIIDAGKITNGAQTMVLVNLLELLKTGNIMTISNLNDAPSSSSEIVEYLKELDDKKVVEIATKLLEILNTKDAINDGDYQFSKTEMEFGDWVKMLIKSQY